LHSNEALVVLGLAQDSGKNWIAMERYSENDKFWVLATLNLMELGSML
jgi:hypothetical protein